MFQVFFSVKWWITGDFIRDKRSPACSAASKEVFWRYRKIRVWREEGDKCHDFSWGGDCKVCQKGCTSACAWLSGEMAITGKESFKDSSVIWPGFSAEFVQLLVWVASVVYVGLCAFLVVWTRGNWLLLRRLINWLLKVSPTCKLELMSTDFSSYTEFVKVKFWTTQLVIFWRSIYYEMK